MSHEIYTSNWQEAYQFAKTTRRDDAQNDDQTLQHKTISNTYTLNRARRLLNLHKFTIEDAAEKGLLTIFIDPDGTARIPAEDVQRALDDTEYYESIAATERIKAKQIAMGMGVNIKTAQKRLRKAGVDPYNPQWYQIRGTWNLPDTLRDFRQLTLQAMQEQRDAKRARAQRKQARRDAERQRRDKLSAQLVASFPSWASVDRSHQMMTLHIGPPNSGKTHDSLNQLAESGSGWYLAPLRLLAWEIHDRLNQRGIPCNLLTGEEYIPVPGAEITAATIEMFNANQSGECVIIDEAQMLADSDRGWAWTRAMMQCQAPEMHVIAPETARELIQEMGQAANIPIGIVEHNRLAPIKVADAPWSLRHTPPKTILVAFSRKMVLALKTKLENLGRSVSVVYGSLPPEVRRRQAERFASGETDICVATDAVGMGLNLPADYVCFYEVEKYDGRQVRRLYPAEVQQIGGRAGRYGISKAGEVGATNRKNLEVIRSLFYRDAKTLTHARVAPSVDDLELIPGNLAEKLQEWSQLESIPPELRGSVTNADLSERIELAAMLTNAEVEILGLADALQLVNAPTRRSTRDYWYDCAQAIIHQRAMPLPPPAPDVIHSTEDLDYTETCIACADIYMWLGNRTEFEDYAEYIDQVNQERREWSETIDEALLKKIRTDYQDILNRRRRR